MQTPVIGWVKRVLWIAIALGVLVAAVGMWRARGTEVTLVRPLTQPITQSLVVSGRVSSVAKVELSATITGRVEKVLVQEGDVVTAGQALIELDNAELRAQLAQAQTAESNARARLRSQQEMSAPMARHALQQARASLLAAERNLKRQRDLFQKGFIGQAKLDEAIRDNDVAKGAYESAQAQLNANAAGGAEREQALTTLNQAIAARQLAEAKLAQATLRAPAAGRVIRRDVEPGTVVQPARALPLLSLAIAGETRLIAQIDEKNLAGLAADQVATASADAYPNERFQAVLFYLAPGIQSNRGTVEARFRVGEPPKFLRDDMTVSIELVMGRRDQALTLPSAALQEKDGKRYVLVMNDHHARLREVKTGLSAPGLVEIVSGVTAEDQVITGSSVEPGTRVRPARARPKAGAFQPPGQ